MNFALRIPDYYKKDIEYLKGNVSINQFIINAVAEKISSLKTAGYMEKKAKNGSIEEVMDILNRVPNRDPKEEDKI